MKSKSILVLSFFFATVYYAGAQANQPQTTSAIVYQDTLTVIKPEEPETPTDPKGKNATPDTKSTIHNSKLVGKDNNAQIVEPKKKVSIISSKSNKTTK